MTLKLSVMSTRVPARVGFLVVKNMFNAKERGERDLRSLLQETDKWFRIVDLKWPGRVNQELWWLSGWVCRSNDVVGLKRSGEAYIGTTRL